jgi:hypothetical protein
MGWWLPLGGDLDGSNILSYLRYWAMVVGGRRVAGRRTLGIFRGESF